MAKSKKKRQPKQKVTQRDTFEQNQTFNIGPDERGEYPSVSRVGYNPTTEANGFIISGPRGNGTI